MRTIENVSRAISEMRNDGGLKFLLDYIHSKLGSGYYYKISKLATYHYL